MRRRLICLALALSLSQTTAAGAIEGAVAEPPAIAPAAMAALEAAAAEARRIAEERETTRSELEAIGSRIQLTEEALQNLDREIAALSDDRSAIRDAMIAAAQAQQTASADLARVQGELDELSISQGEVRASLEARRGTLAHVLGALERMGRKPAPAILVHPDDALGSVRSAILLGSVVPRIRQETEALVADLADLERLHVAIETRKARFSSALARQREEEARLTRLFAEKERLEADTRQTRDEMKGRTAELAGRATTLQDLIGSLETDLARAEQAETRARDLAERRAAEAEAEAEAEAQRVAQARAEREAIEAERGARLSVQNEEGPARPDPEPDEAGQTRLAALEPPAEPARPAYDVASLRRDMERLDVSAAFSTMKGILSPPVVGDVKLAFGADDGFGRKADGMTFSAGAGDLVTAPADGRILYSGPFRSYGQLLILNAGDGYHIVLAGMREIDVDVGQFVLAGEPVAVMGARRLASTGVPDLPSTEPSLYVEFRKDGKPVDPAPWWAEGPSGRTGNDS